MKETKIVLRDIQSVREFVGIVVMLDYEVDLVQGRYIVDAKSIMGIFALDMLSPITLVAHTEDATEFFNKIEKFAAN
jgi:phosphotransferase system HPr-like phosphotransfer protein